MLGGGRRFITPSDVAESVEVDAQTAAKKLARWAADGWVRRVRRGLYIGVPVDAANPTAWSEDALVVASEVWSPCYFTGWTAARQWAMTEQVFRTTVLKTTCRVRSSTVELLDHEYIVAHVGPQALQWGMGSEWRDGIRLRFADPARTIVDMLDAPKLGGGIRHVAEMLAAVTSTIKNLAPWSSTGTDSEIERCSSAWGISSKPSALTRPALLEACQERVSSGISALDPDGPPGGHRVMRWGLRINVTVVQEGAS